MVVFFADELLGPSILKPQVIGAEDHIAPQAQFKSIMIHGVFAEPRDLRLADIKLVSVLMGRDNGGVFGSQVFWKQEVRLDPFVLLHVVPDPL